MLIYIIYVKEVKFNFEKKLYSINITNLNIKH